MKKLLILVLITLILVLTIYTVMQDIEIGDVTILSIQGIQNKSKDLEDTIDQATKLKTIEYPKKVDEIETNMKKLNQEKQTYQDMVSVSSSEDIQTANQFEKYEIERLWVQLGNHATAEGVDMKMAVANGNTSETYNLNFTVNGDYVGTTNFIYNIENDTSLGFKIEEFKMIPGTSADILTTTFTCKNIQIVNVSNASSQSAASSMESEDTMGTSGMTQPEDMETAMP